MTEAQILLQIHLSELGIQTVPELRFAPPRRWRFDLACEARKLAFECDGGAFHGGHKRGKALMADYEKQNVAALLGWKLFRFTNDYILNGSAKLFLADSRILLDKHRQTR